MIAWISVGLEKRYFWIINTVGFFN